MHAVARLVLTGAVGAAVLLAAGCDGPSAGDPATSGPAATSSAPTSASPSASPSPTAFTATCDSALSLDAVGRAAGQPIVGDTAFVVGEADPSIGRQAYLNCRYGLPSAPDPSAPVDPTAAPTPATAALPAVEIGVSLYDTAKRASDRVAGTVSDYRSTGAAATEVAVGSATGTLLQTPGEPRTLVVADGRRTVAVTVADAVYTGDDQVAAIAALALEQVS